MRRDDTFDDVLRAFAVDLREPVDQEDLDRTYSEAVAEGLVHEVDLKRSFDEFLSRRVERTPGTGEVRLVPRLPATVGELVKSSRMTRGLTQAEFAHELHLRPEDLDTIEACDAAYDPERLSEGAKALANVVPVLTLSGARRLLQRIRVMLGLQDATGPFLKAARRPPGE